MLSGEGNENGEKTTIGLISKKATLHVQHTFFVHFFAVVLHDYNVKWKFQNIPSYTFYGWNVVHVVVFFVFCLFAFFFSLPLIFTLVAASISDFLIATSKFSCCFSNKKCLLLFLFLFFFLSLALALCRSFLRLASLACRLLSPFLCLSLSLFSKFVAVTINLSLILWQHGCRNNFRFRLYWLFSCLCFPRRGWPHAISSQNNLELHLGCWLSYFTLVCLCCGRTGGLTYGHVVTKLPLPTDNTK